MTHHHYRVVWPKAVFTTNLSSLLLPAVVENKQQLPKPSPCPSVRAQEHQATLPPSAGRASGHGILSPRHQQAPMAG